VVNNWKPILAALTIFAAGFVTGGLTLGGHRPDPDRAEPARGDNRKGPKPERSKEGHLRDLCGRLELELRLTPVQRERIEEIIRLAHQRVKVVADKMGPLIHSEFKQMEQDILEELTPDQAQKFQAIIRERESKFGRGDRGDPPPPGLPSDRGPEPRGEVPPPQPPEN
jgi:hypothetical protein